MLIVIISIIGVVNASDDINGDNIISDSISASDDDVYTETLKSNEVVLDSTNKGNSFTDLKSEMYGSEEVNLTQDYVYDEEKDSSITIGISLEHRGTLVINGNNHTIDAKNKGPIFQIDSSNIVLNNIIFKNSENTAVNIINSNVTSNNNIFINDMNNSRALRAHNSSVTSNNDCFIDNYNKYGASVIASNSILEINNATFSNKNNLNWASVYVTGKSSEAYIINSTFMNITSKYAPAIFFDSAQGTVLNCTFRNLFANLTGGAIGIKDVNGTVMIINSSFINVSSVKNGGAIFVDVDQEGQNGYILLNNCLFDDCYSFIGGAYVQLGGELDIINTTFKNNHAYIEGGAVYTSFTDLTIENSTFKDNIVLYDDDFFSMGGALYADKTDLVMTDCIFTGNYALSGEEILLYDSTYDISNSYFDGKIYSLYDTYSVLENNTFKKDNVLNASFNPYVYKGPGGIIKYDPIILDESLVNSSYFNLVDYGLVTDVKDQGEMGACWAFGTVGALESAFLKATNRKLVLDISENNVQNLGLKYSPYGNYFRNEGGIRTMGASYFLSWLGVTNTEDDEYDELGKLSPILGSENKYFIYDVIYIDPRQNMTDNLKLKEALIKYGAIGISVHGAQGSEQEDYDESTASAYYNSTFGDGTDHSVTLVGWNDSYSKDNFLITPPGDGAWIIKNSWGSDWGDNGYYYVSYYDTAVATEKILIAFTINDSFNYERNYEYELTASPVFQDNITGTIAIGNKFTAVYDELITAIGSYFNESGVNYEIIVYVDNEEMYRQKGISSHYGYETIKLEQPVGVRENHTFLIKLVSNNVALSAYSRKHNDENTSFIYENDNVTDISAENVFACLKAYTITDNSQIKTSNLTTGYGSGEYIKVTYYDENGELLCNKEVQFIINNKIYTRTTDYDGTAILDVNLQAGTYIVTVVNPVNLEKTNVTLTILETPTNNIVPSRIIIKDTPVHIIKKISYPSYKIYKNDKLVSQSNTITIKTLNMIFNQSFTNGHLVVYLDGILIFNGTVTDDIYTVILEITSKLLGQHELKVEFTDNNNETNSYAENITITM